MLQTRLNTQMEFRRNYTRNTLDVYYTGIIITITMNDQSEASEKRADYSTLMECAKHPHRNQPERKYENKHKTKQNAKYFVP